MSWTRAFKIHSTAQYICMFTLALSFGVVQKAGAAFSDPITKEECEKAKTSDLTTKQTAKCSSYSETSSSKNACVSAWSDVLSARKELNRKCGDAGMGSNCEATLKKCDDVAAANEGGSDDEFLRALGQSLGTTQADASKCPRYSGQGFADKKDKYERSLDDINDKLGDIKKDTSELNDQFNKDVQDIQEDLSKSQEELKQKGLDLSKSQRERATEMGKTTAEVAAQIRQKQSEILKLRTQIAETYRSKNSNLIVLTDNAAKRACMKKVNEMKKDYANIAGGSLRSGFTAASTKKKELNDTYDECMSQFDVQRSALISQTDEKVQDLQNSINNNQSDIDNANQQLASMTATEAQNKVDEATAQTNAQTALTEKTTRAQTRLTSLSQTTQAKAKALSEKQTYYENKSKSVSTSISKLGPAPDDESSTTKMSQVRGYQDDYDKAYETFLATKDDDGNTCSAPSTSAKKSGSSKSKAAK